MKGGKSMANFIDKTMFWFKINEDAILNFLAYVITPILVIGILVWITLS
jgi:hypothetical protein